MERSSIAHDLIKFDHKFSRPFSGRPAKDVMDEEGISMSEFKEAFAKGNMFASGIAVNYGGSSIVAKAPEAAETNGTTGASKPVASRQELATEVKVGMRMPSHKVLNQSDARPWHFQERLPSNGTWRVVLFPGDLTKADRRADLEAVSKQMSQPTSFLKRFTPKNGRYDSVIEVLTVHAGNRQEFGIF